MESERVGEFIAAKQALVQEINSYVPQNLNPEGRSSEDRFSSLWQRGLTLMGVDSEGDFGGGFEIHGRTENGSHVKLEFNFQDSRIFHYTPDPRRKIEAYWYDGATGERIGAQTEFVNDGLVQNYPDEERTLLGLALLEETMTVAERFAEQDDEDLAQLRNADTYEITPYNAQH